MTLGFLNIGTQEVIFIVIIILLLFGGKKLPELARGLGKGIREFKDASDGIKREISDQINNFEKDLDVKVEDKPTPYASNPENFTEEPKAAADEVTAAEEVTEEKKPFPQFTAPENAVQHNPGQQPGADHYTYGYEDHFADQEKLAENADATPEETTSNEHPSKSV